MERLQLPILKIGEDLTLPMGSLLWKIMQERKKRANNHLYVFTDRGGESHISDRRSARLKVAQESGITFTFHDLCKAMNSIENVLLPEDIK